jgi:hypothetical protein
MINIWCNGCMIKLDKSLRAWGTPGFETVLKQEVALLGADQLPLQLGLSNSSSVSNEPVTVVINRVVELADVIRVKAGIFYQGIINGCSCADDPTPDNEINEYCEVQLDIDKLSAATEVMLVAEALD